MDINLDGKSVVCTYSEVILFMFYFRTTVLDITAVFVIAIIVFILMVICSGVIIWRSCRTRKEKSTDALDSVSKINEEENKYYEIVLQNE